MHKGCLYKWASRVKPLSCLAFKDKNNKTKKTLIYGFILGIIKWPAINKYLKMDYFEFLCDQMQQQHKQHKKNTKNGMKTWDLGLELIYF